MAVSILQRWRDEKRNKKFKNNSASAKLSDAQVKAKKMNEYRPPKLKIIEADLTVAERTKLKVKKLKSVSVPMKQLPSGFSMPSFGVGMWSMSITDDKKLKNPPLQAAKTAINTGVTCIATSGLQSELEVAKVIKGHKREELFLVSKIVIDHDHFYDTVNAVTYALKRLKTKYIDLALLSIEDPDVSLQTVAQAINAMMEKGLVKNVGVVNCGQDQITQLNFYLTNKVVANLLRYNLEVQRPNDEGLLDFCRDNGLFLITHHPVTKNLLDPKMGSVIGKLCKKHNATPSQIALAWLLFQSNVVVFNSMSRVDNFHEDVLALDFKLNGDEYEELTREFAKSDK